MNKPVAPAMPALDPASVAPRSGSGYPAPYRDAVAKREKRALGDALGLSHFGVNLVRAVEYIDPTVAEGYAAKALGVKLRTPLFQIERITYAMNDQVVEYRHALLRGDAYRYRLDLR